MENVHLQTGIGEGALLNKDKAFLIATADVLMEEILLISTIVAAHNVDIDVVSEKLMVQCINFACTQQAAHGLMKLISTCFDETTELTQSSAIQNLYQEFMQDQRFILKGFKMETTLVVLLQLW